MTSQEYEPQLGAESFSCPHCNAVAHQDWYWPAPGSEDTELGALMELKVGHGVAAATDVRGAAAFYCCRLLLIHLVSCVDLFFWGGGRLDFGTCCPLLL